MKACRKPDPRRPSRGTGGGSCGRRLGESSGVDGGTCRWKAPRARTSPSFGWDEQNGSWLLRSCSGCRASFVRSDMGRLWVGSSGSSSADKALSGYCVGHRATPWGDGSVAAGRCSTNCAADPGLETPAMAIQRRRGRLGQRVGLPPSKKLETVAAGRRRKPKAWKWRGSWGTRDN